ncbi:MAG: hypothetical protein EOM29_10700 [Bacteroidia bacterium]|nr:hypothetical protein [Bacteroidia bacterium]
MMQDDFNWEYVGTSKKKQLAKFEKEFEKIRFKPTKIAQWRGIVIYDIDKTPPYIEEYRDIIKKYCDSAWYWDDSGNFKIVEIDFFN